ncbi:MAG: hypothetical protein AAF483_30885, partial [Planctomycetota bacterium]
MPRFFILVLLAVIAQPLAFCWAEFPTIELQTISQSCFQAGSKATLQPRGQRLDELSALVFSESELTAEQQESTPGLLQAEGTGTGVFDLQVAPNASPGIVQLRAKGRFGISNPRPILVTSQPVTPLSGDHSNRVLAKPLAEKHIYTSVFAPAKRTFFQIKVPKGQMLRCVVYAKQLDSRAIPNLVLMTEAGSELKRARALGYWPAEIQYEANEDEIVNIAAHDFLFQGGAEYFYALEVSLSAIADESNGPDTTSTELDRLLRPNLQAGPERFSDPACLTEGNEKPPKSPQANQVLAAPFKFSADLSQGFYEQDFSAKKDESIVFELASSQLHQLTDPHLLVYSVQGEGETETTKLVANLDDGPTLGGPELKLLYRDPTLKWKAPADGRYRLKILDKQAGSHPPDAKAICVEARRESQVFRLLAIPLYPNNNRSAVKPSGCNLMCGGTTAIRVLAVRQDGFNGPIELQVTGLPTSVSCPGVVLPAGATEQVLVLSADENAVAWEGPVEVLGRSTLPNGSKLESKAQATTVFLTASSGRNQIQTRKTDQLRMSVNDQDKAPLLVSLGDSDVLEVRQGTNISIPIKVIRRDGGKVECVLRPQNLPRKVTLGEVKIPADKAEGKAEIKVAKDAPLGEANFWMLNEVKVSWRANPQAQAR